MGKEYEKIKAEISVRISTEDIDDIVTTALEGGICYWCRRAEVKGKYLGEFASEQISRGGVLEVTQERVDKLLEECHRIFDDKSGRNEMLARKASELFEEE